jgi:flagellar motility protein MotE (MotC chaperone)
MVERHERQIEKLQAKVAGEDKEDVEKATKQLEKAQRLLDDTREAIQALEEFYDESKKKWSKPSQRVLGHIVRSPPITPGAGIEGFTEDYAVVELDSSRIKDAFKGNVIDLGAF